jgi:hypothetical protein
MSKKRGLASEPNHALLSHSFKTANGDVALLPPRSGGRFEWRLPQAGPAGAGAGATLARAQAEQLVSTMQAAHTPVSLIAVGFDGTLIHTHTGMQRNDLDPPVRGRRRQPDGQDSLPSLDAPLVRPYSAWPEMSEPAALAAHVRPLLRVLICAALRGGLPVAVVTRNHDEALVRATLRSALAGARGVDAEDVIVKAAGGGWEWEAEARRKDGVRHAQRQREQQQLQQRQGAVHDGGAGIRVAAAAAAAASSADTTVAGADDAFEVDEPQHTGGGLLPHLRSALADVAQMRGGEDGNSSADAAGGAAAASAPRLPSLSSSSLPSSAAAATSLQGAMLIEHDIDAVMEAKEQGLGVDVWFPVRAPVLVRTGEAFAARPEEDAWCEQQLLAMLQRRVMAMGHA